MEHFSRYSMPGLALAEYRFPNQLRVCELIFSCLKKSNQDIFPYFQYVFILIIFGRMLSKKILSITKQN